MFDVIIKENIVTSNFLSKDDDKKRYYMKSNIGTPVFFGSAGFLARKMKNDGSFKGGFKFYQEFAKISKDERPFSFSKTTQTEYYQTYHRFGLEFEIEADALAFKLAW